MTGRRSSRQDTWSSIRLSPELHDRLRAEAEARDLTLTRFVSRLLEEGLGRLVPVEELTLTREPA